MLTTVTFTANSQVGNLSRLILALRRLGYRAIEQSLEQSKIDRLDLIKMTLESPHSAHRSDFADIRTMVPTIVDFDIMKSQPLQTKSTVKSLSQLQSRTLVLSSQSASQQAKLSSGSDTILGYVKNEGRKLIAAYPDVAGSIKRLETEVWNADREEVFSKLGAGIGRWQYKKNFAVGARLSLEKALLRSLKPALSDFLNVSIQDTTISVTDCPHCAGSRNTSENSCYFVSSFIEAFMNEMSHLRGLHVEQVLAKSMGASACQFKIRR